MGDRQHGLQRNTGEVQLSAVAASCVVTLKRVGGEICSSRSEIGKSEKECFG